MADNSKKYFLDLGGLNTLWEKIKGTFAEKSDVAAIEGDVSNLSNTVQSLGQEIDSLSEIVVGIAPKKEGTYSEALAKIDSLPEGVIIKIMTAEEVDGVTYASGLYIVDSDANGNKILKYIGTSSGSGDSGDLANLTTRVDDLESIVITGANIVAGESTTQCITNENTLIIQYDDVFVPNSDSMNALTHAAIAKKFGELELTISGIPKFKIEVVDELPTNNISLSTIYLKKSSEEENNLYSEYIYIQNSGWEKLGEQSINISDFVTNETLSNMLTAYAKTADVTKAISTAVSEHNAQIEAKYATKEELNSAVSSLDNRLTVIEGLSGDWTTEAEILKSIQSNEEGSIGHTIAIPIIDIEQLS